MRARELSPVRASPRRCNVKFSENVTLDPSERTGLSRWSDLFCIHFPAKRKRIPMRIVFIAFIFDSSKHNFLWRFLSARCCCFSNRKKKLDINVFLCDLKFPQFFQIIKVFVTLRKIYFQQRTSKSHREENKLYLNFLIWVIQNH